MVKFSALPCTLVFAVFFLVANQGKNHPDDPIDSRYEEGNASSAEDKNNRKFSTVSQLKIESNSDIWSKKPRRVSEVGLQGVEPSSEIELEAFPNATGSFNQMSKLNDTANNYHVTLNGEQNASTHSPTNTKDSLKVFAEGYDLSSSKKDSLFMNNNASSDRKFSANLNPARNNHDGIEKFRISEGQFLIEFKTAPTNERNKLTLSNDSSIETFPETRGMSSTKNAFGFKEDFKKLSTSHGKNRSSEAVDSVSRTTRGLTLMNFKGPIIAQDAESAENNGAVNSNYVRVKREFQDSDRSLGGIRDGDSSGEKISFFEFDDGSNDVKNELGDLYPDLTDDSLSSSSPVQLIRKKRLNYEMLVPKSYVRSEHETQTLTPEVRDNNAEYISGPVFFESFSKYDNSLDPRSVQNPVELSPRSFTHPGLKTGFKDSKEDGTDLLNVADNSTTGDNRASNSSSLDDSPDIENREISKRIRKKRYAQSKVRKIRKGPKGGHGKTHNSKHRKKHKKKRKKHKKPAKTRKERSESNLGVNLNSEHADSKIDRNEIQFSDNHEAPGSKDNEIQLSRDKRTIGYGKSNGDCGNEELRYYEDVYEPSLRTQRDNIELKRNPDDKVGKERAARSVEQIKKLAKKLIGKVDELEKLVNSADNAESKRGKKKAEKEEDSSWNSTRKIEGTDLKNVSKEDRERKVCADETDATKLKLDPNETAGDKAIEKSGESETREKILSRRQTTRKRKIRKRKLRRKWDVWTDWSSCSVTCGKGRQIRWRHCIHDCTSAETEMEEKSCQLPACGPGKFLGIF